MSDPHQGAADWGPVCLGSQISRLRLSNLVFARVFEDEPDPVRIGRYAITRKLGEGSMGIVYLAHDERLGRPVAVKILRRRHCDGGQYRFMREAKSLARISHHNVVKIHEVGEHEGQAFIVMEYVEGVTLREWLDAQTRSLAEVLEVFGGAASGLQAAHRRGLVHRDFKPTNVIVGAGARVVVVDFGLARDQGGPVSTMTPREDQGPRAELTEVGTILGTPAYMAPEQFQGIKADARSDQFSFCVALWEAVHGARPFRGETVEEIHEAVCAGRIEASRAGAPEWFDAALIRGLDVEPRRRWPSLEVLMWALQPAPRRWTRRLGVALRGLIFVLAAVAGWRCARVWPDLGALSQAIQARAP